MRDIGINVVLVVLTVLVVVSAWIDSAANDKQQRDIEALQTAVAQRR